MCVCESENRYVSENKKWRIKIDITSKEYISLHNNNITPIRSACFNYFILSFFRKELDGEGSTTWDASPIAATSGAYHQITIKKNILFHVSIFFEVLTSFYWYLHWNDTKKKKLYSHRFHKVSASFIESRFVTTYNACHQTIVKENTLYHGSWPLSLDLKKLAVSATCYQTTKKYTL